ncbi:MAG: hypothetical protein Q8Q15_02460 [bacterium]|nr:hypothetical protein [bacterium]
MTKEALLHSLPGLPTIEIGTIAKDPEIIKGNEGNVHYKMTKESVCGLVVLLSLSVSGSEEERIRFIEEIALELGKPNVITELSEIPGIHFAA